MTRRGELTVADGDQRPELERMLALDGIGGHVIREISAAEAHGHGPDHTAGAVALRRL